MKFGKSIQMTALLAILLSGAIEIQAQKGKISLAAGGGFSKLTSDLGSKGSFGLNYLLEGKYFLSKNVAAGLEYNASIIAYGSEGGLLGVSAYEPSLIQVKGEYFVGSGKIKPYAGLGLGGVRLATPEIEFSDANGNVTGKIPSESKFNFSVSPRLGLMLGRHWSFDFSYNIAGKTPETTQQNVSSSNKAFNYMSLALKYAYNIKGGAEDK